MSTPAFQFLDPGPLIDRDLELVVPQARLLDDVLAACGHPLTGRDAPQEASTSRHQVEQFLEAVPRGRDPGDATRGRVPAYHFWMRWHAGPDVPDPVKIAGGISLRIGTNRGIELYYGNFGYHVYPPARGRRFASRACRLLLPLAHAHGIRTLWITCNPENHASRATCELLGARLIEIIPVPEDDPLYARGDHAKCRFRVDI